VLTKQMVDDGLVLTPKSVQVGSKLMRKKARQDALR